MNGFMVQFFHCGFQHLSYGRSSGIASRYSGGVIIIGPDLA